MSHSGTKKLFVETHGCQMNEYDSARMADLLGASHGLEQTDSADEADVLLLNTCSIREKAQEKVFHQLGRWKHLKEGKAGPDHWCRRLRREPGRGRDWKAGALCRFDLWSADTPSTAGNDRGSPPR